jgi:hypothetical protein
VLPRKMLPRLSSLEILSLAWCPFVNTPYLKQLCMSMPQLTALNLSNSCDKIGAGLSALQHLTNLEVLALRGEQPFCTVLADLKHVRAPPSLRRCYLGEYWEPRSQAAARAYLGSHVVIVCTDWTHPW